MKKTFNAYQRFVARLFSACEIGDDYPESPVLVDTKKISDILENEFIKTGLLEVREDYE